MSSVNIPWGQLEEALQSNETGFSSFGFCLSCGELADGVEPDARKYVCECCGDRSVYGAEEILIMGRIDYSEEE